MGMINTDEIFSEETEDEYFDLINKKIETTKVSSLPLSPTKKQNYDNKPIKYWKKVILHFLEKQNKLGITWCKELFQIINAYQFSSEQKYLDHFFWQKFELSTKPTCLNNSLSSLNNSFSLASIQSQLNEEKLSSSKSLNLNDLTSSQYLSELSNNEYEKNKLKLKEYISIFKLFFGILLLSNSLLVCKVLIFSLFCKYSYLILKLLGILFLEAILLFINIFLLNIIFLAFIFRIDDVFLRELLSTLFLTLLIILKCELGLIISCKVFIFLY